MSALTPNADIAKHYWDVHFAPKADIMQRSKKSCLFDHLVGSGNERSGKFKAECFRSLRVDDQFQLG